MILAHAVRIRLQVIEQAVGDRTYGSSTVSPDDGRPRRPELIVATITLAHDL
jgi:hypothetical protein